MPLPMLAPSSPGTRVSDLASDEEVYQGKITIKGFATIDQVTLISVEVSPTSQLSGRGPASLFGPCLCLPLFHINNKMNLCIHPGMCAGHRHGWCPWYCQRHLLHCA
jgi:hypothetical protein